MNAASNTPCMFPLSRHSGSETRMLLRCGLLFVGIFLSVTLLNAKILKTRNVRTTYGARLPLTIGLALEYQADSEESEYGFPFYTEWAFSDALQLSIEPNYARIHSKTGGSVNGWGDIETCLIYEILPETRRRPAFAVEGLIKWPTTNDQRRSSGEMDYTIGGIVSKELGPVDLDANVDYTFVGSPSGVRLKNRIEISLSAEWHLSPTLDIEGELVGSSGGFSGKPGTIGGSVGTPEQTNSLEGVIGLAERLGRHLKLEEGIVVVSDGSWQAVIAWEWAFSGE